MTFLGLHWIDSALILIYIVIVLAIGEILSRKTKTENDFFLGGRKLGKWFQFFLNFGNMTDPSGATATASSVYKQGIGGVWLMLITLFLTPYYWFMSVWFRRSRLTTMADLFEDRFGSRFLPTLYAVVAIGLSVLVIGFGNVIALKTLQPIMVKPVSAYSDQDKKSVAQYDEFKSLQKERLSAALPPDKLGRYELLKGLYDRGMILPYVSYLEPWSFYLASSMLVAIFIMLGGLTASAMVDSLQAVLVMVISIILIPFGLARIGGFAELHRQIPEHMFEMFGGSTASDYTWYSICAFLFMSFVSINAAGGNMNIGGSARNELAARLGAVTGGFGKRFITISWGFVGLIAIVVCPNLADPDQAWGAMTRTLLPVGLIGLMIIGILGGKLAALGATSVVNSALVVKNLYTPLFPNKSEKHYMLIARLTVPALLLLGILVALFSSNAISLLKFIMVIGVIWGAPIFLLMHWKRLTKLAVYIQVITCLLFIVVIPLAVSATPALRRAPVLTEMTNEKKITVQAKATREDVAAGRATHVGQRIPHEQIIEPKAIFFEDGVARIDPSNPDSPKEGLGRFSIEMYFLSLVGFDVKNFTPPVMFTGRFLVPSLLPILLLLVLSLITPASEPGRVARFYVRLKTPVGETPEIDAEEVEKGYANPTRFDHLKLFPRSNWEFSRWDKQDITGFAGCCAFVGVVLIFLQGLLMVGK